MISVDMKQAKRLEKVLGDIRSRAVPFAQRNTINDMAFDAMRGARNNVRSDFINRNTWTARTISTNKARRPGDYAEVGSSESYMKKQELGGTGEKYEPTGNATGESPRVSPRRRVVRRSNWINTLQVHRSKFSIFKGKRGKISNRRESNIAALKDAKESGMRHVILDRGYGRVGIYRVMGTRKKPKSKLLYRIRRHANKIKKDPWLEPASSVASKMGPTYYFAQMRKELARIKPL